ncbi:MAG: 16S rRNA (cytidine(1402)-2'-O)-methyltransferase [Opitutae bacterium]|nr:16S rRNA (cytidine(1402)-2'-O)-methyltransferase [Opitutae bacterium]MCD8299440.1 16S rRNA (cytidine(1402)-2'-O)-methyltransferase [Opitutae bacterium]
MENSAPQNENTESDNVPARKNPRLSVVATPIGNLADISERAKQTLAVADFIACEDTRTSGNLLRKFNISRPLLACHDHNESASANGIADKISAGAHVALVCDAGTPTLSDPGFRVVRECRRRGLDVEPIPGACALIAALSASGLPTNAFAYHGFLAPKTSARRKFLEENRDSKITLAVYESCHRIRAFAEEIAEILGGARIVCFAREMTKLHETILTGKISEILPQLVGKNLKGEFVVLIAPANFEL